MKNKKVLIVSYYWYPFAGVGTYRVSRFTKYLAKSGWDVVVLTAKKSAAGMKGEPDDPVLKNIPVYRANLIEPVGLLNSKKGGKISSSNPGIFYQQKKSLISRIAVWARLNLMIPDAKFTWKWFAISKGKKIIAKEKPDLILSTSPPPTTNLIAKKLAEWSKLPWLADFRDPWTNIYYYDDNPQGNRAARKNRKMEASVLNKADQITVVNHGFFPHHNLDQKVVKIPNGYDPDHIIRTESDEEKTSVFTIRYFGSLKANQHPKAFIKALETISDKHPDIAKRLRFEFFGSIDPIIRQQLEAISLIETTFSHFISHDEMMMKVASSDLLLLVIGRTKNSRFALSTKVFEYMISKKPVLGIGPINGAASKLVEETNIGSFFDHSDADGITSYILNSIHTAGKGEIAYDPNMEAIEKYSFTYLTKQLEEQMNTLIK